MKITYHSNAHWIGRVIITPDIVNFVNMQPVVKLGL